MRHLTIFQRAVLVVALTTFAIIWIPTSTSAQDVSADSQFNTSSYTIVVEPQGIIKVKQEEQTNVTIYITVDEISVSSPPVIVRISVGESDTSAILVYGIDGAEINVTTNGTTNATFQLTGNLVGKWTMKFGFYSMNSSEQFLNNSLSTFQIYGLRVSTSLQDASTLSAAICISTTMASFTSRVNTDAVKAFFKGPKVGLLSVLVSYIIMPLISFGMSFAWNLPYSMMFTMVAVGCCPPGGPANAVSLALGGELETSIIITTLGTILSIAFSPIWMSTLGEWIARQAYGPTFVIRYPILALDIFICIFFLPSIIVFAISHKWPKTGKIMSLIVRPLSMMGSIVSVILIIYSNGAWFFPLNISWTYIAAPTSVSLIGYAIGFFTALLLGKLSVGQAVTFGVQTGVANVIFAIVMGALMLKPPDGDICYVPPFWFAISSLIIALILVPTVAIGRWLVKKYWPSSFVLETTDQKIQAEARRKNIKQKKLARTLSVISTATHLRKASLWNAFEKNVPDDDRDGSENNFTEITMDDNNSNSSDCSSAVVEEGECKATFDIAKY